ncbi:MAG: alpha/beta fold hydrolase [Promethearchaeota archaeon]|nr:MAG: alpha/beta fold hydrolase [Candidatus Lokiarchaeota archaeon]
MVLAIRDETFEGTFPFRPHYKEINGFQMHYVDEGREEPIVCVHGEPTWGYLYRKFITSLSNNHRVVVPDHMGFGKSEVPQNKQYRLEQHVDNLSKLLLALDLKDVTLVFQNWGGPIALGFATRYPDRVKRLIIMNSSVGVAKPDRQLWYESMLKDGTYDQLMGNMQVFIPNMMFGTFVRKIPFAEKKIMKKAYMGPFPTPESNIGARAFPLDIPKGTDHPSSQIMQEVRDNLHLFENTPKIIIWGMKDRIFPPKIIQVWLKQYPNTTVYELSDAGHFLQEDAPEKIIAIIDQFLSET